MRPQQLADSIMEDAKKRVREIKRDMDTELKKIRQETDEILKAKEQEALKDVAQKEEEERNRQEASREREARLAILKEKRDLLRETFENAATSLGNLSGKDREKILSRLWKKASDQITVKHVIAAKKDASFLRELTTVEQETDGYGGFVAVSDDGNVSIDLRFETLLQEVQDQKVKEVANILFAE